LIGIALNISGEILHGCQTQLPTGTGTPRIHTALDIYGNSVAITTGNLIDPFVSQVLDL
jgi:hypothetical protein